MDRPRVTLSDFERLQAQLLQTRELLYESRERELNATAALARMKPTTFPPPPRASTANNADVAASQREPQYPEELNPFAAPSVKQCSVATQTDIAFNAALGRGAEFRRATARACFDVHQRTERLWLLRLIFLGWRSSHNQMAILRNMRALASANLPGECHSAVRLEQLHDESAPSRAADDNANAFIEECTAVQSVLLVDELRRVEQELHLGHKTCDALRQQCNAYANALHELALTAAALHGRALCALDDPIVLESRAAGSRKTVLTADG